MFRMMQRYRMIASIREPFHGRSYQSLAILFCVLFGIAMIANTQMAGEAWWFWYARLYHSGARLYADLHFALQPLLVLQTDAWIQLFGVKCLVTEIPSLMYVIGLCMAIFLILRESDWPDWQKAILLASAFLICVECGAYRFDDFHVMTDTFVCYSVVLLLLMAKADATRRQLFLAAVLGILSGLTVTTRLNDGGALLAATGVCLLFLTRERKLIVVSLFFFAAALTAVIVVKLTGDSLSDYASNSIFRATAAKGGTGVIFLAPFRLFLNALHALRGSRWIYLRILAIVAVGALVQRCWKNDVRYIVMVQLGMAGAVFIFSSQDHRNHLLSGALFSFMCISLLVLNYLLLPVVAAHYLASKTVPGGRGWDPREFLVLAPLAELASVSTSTGASATSIFWSPIAVLLLLIPAILPFRRKASWANASLVTIVALMGLSAMREKIHYPYSWILVRSSPMFVNRQWYQHPVYGPLYIDSDLLRFIEPVCKEIRASGSSPELLAMPFAYPNYFCDTPPWHGYVQTWFDTSTKAAIDSLAQELDIAPPQWIVYQRQLDVLSGYEKAYNQGRPMAHRDLDTMIMQKIATGEWQVVGTSNYLEDKVNYQGDDVWLIIRTRP